MEHYSEMNYQRIIAETSPKRRHYAITANFTFPTHTFTSILLLCSHACHSTLAQTHKYWWSMVRPLWEELQAEKHTHTHRKRGRGLAVWLEVRVITTSHVNGLAMVIARLEHLHAVNFALPGRTRLETRGDGDEIATFLSDPRRHAPPEGREPPRLVLPLFYFGSDA